jgi:hypothetical protein
MMMEPKRKKKRDTQEEEERILKLKMDKRKFLKMESCLKDVVNMKLHQ